MSQRKKVSHAASNAVVINGTFKCDFCGWADDDILKYGPKYELGNVKAHYYCVLLSNRLKQNGKDNEGMLGFLLKDIVKELKRCSKIKCVYCGNSSASIICEKRHCKRSFHLPCGLKAGTLHQFKNSYSSYCHSHRNLQYIPKEILKEVQESQVVCCICLDKVPLWNKMTYIWAPCCQKSWYHKRCLQRLALSAGYFFRCAICNNSRKFINCVLKYGVFIPQQDASWELVPNAFSELLFRYEQCDAKICKCPNGRRGNSENMIWEIILCKSCGSQGIHKGCINSNFINLDWECPSCQKVTENLNSKNSKKLGLRNQFKSYTQQEVLIKKRGRATEDLENSILDKRKKCKSEMEESEEDIEIDVVTIDDSETETEDNPYDAVKQSSEVTVVKETNRQDFQEAAKRMPDMLNCLTAVYGAISIYSPVDFTIGV